MTYVGSIATSDANRMEKRSFMYVTMQIMEYTKSASFNSARKPIHLYVLGAPVYLKNDRGLIYYENFRLYIFVYAFFISL